VPVMMQTFSESRDDMTCLPISLYLFPRRPQLPKKTLRPCRVRMSRYPAGERSMNASYLGRASTVQRTPFVVRSAISDPS